MEMDSYLVKMECNWKKNSITSTDITPPYTTQTSTVLPTANQIEIGKKRSKILLKSSLQKKSFTQKNLYNFFFTKLFTTLFTKLHKQSQI